MRVAIQGEKALTMARNISYFISLQKEPLPVDIEHVIKRFGVRIVFKDFPPAFDALIAYSDAGYPLIVANSDKPPNRLRFSLAHEFGHFIIPWHYWDRVYLGKKPLHFESEYHLEVEANLFAGEMLMPYEKFYPLAIDPKVSVEEISTTFKTSVAAVKSRYGTILRYKEFYEEVSKENN